MTNKPIQDIGESLNKIKQNAPVNIKNPYVPIEPYTPKLPTNINISKKRNLFMLIGGLLLLAVIIFFIIFTIYYYKDTCSTRVSFGTYLSGFDPTASSCESIDHKPTLVLDKKKKKEVFHIGDQVYTYKQAQCKCNSYGGKLATKGEITQAYNRGGNWCSYGWSDGKAAYYPTQKCEWDKLQKTSKKNKCGNPGVNGGKFPETIRFGANCYGYKPMGRKIKEEQRLCTTVESEQSFCEKNKDGLGISTSDELVDFNNEKWSIYDN